MKSLVCTVILVTTLEELIGLASSFTVNSRLGSSHRAIGSSPCGGGGSTHFLCYREGSSKQHRTMYLSQGGLRMAGDGASDDTPKPRRQRRKRKDPTSASVDTTREVSDRQESNAATAATGIDPVQSDANSAAAGSPTTPPPPVVVRSSSAVQLEVVDVRDVVAGRPSSMGMSSSSKSSSSSMAQDSLSSQTFSVSSVGPGSSQARKRSDDDDDAFARLLRDAQQMQQSEKDEVSGDASASPGFSLPNAAKNAISTLITVDFFLICGFLLWFLAGIFASTVLQNDAIQIAFNGIFQPVVQPALGLLMIGSIASAVFKGEEEDVANSR